MCFITRRFEIKTDSIWFEIIQADLRAVLHLAERRHAEGDGEGLVGAPVARQGGADEVGAPGPHQLPLVLREDGAQGPLPRQDVRHGAAGMGRGEGRRGGLLRGSGGRGYLKDINKKVRSWISLGEQPHNS